MGRRFTKYPSDYVKANEDFPESKYKILILTPDFGNYADWTPDAWNTAIKNKLPFLMRDLEDLSEIRSVRPGKIISDKSGGCVDLPIQFLVGTIYPPLWQKIQTIAHDNGFLAIDIC